MKTPSKMSEESMQRMEAHIPTLAQIAVQRARQQALTTGGKVLEARAGQLIESYADGSVRVMRNLAQPTTVALGSKRLRVHPV